MRNIYKKQNLMVSDLTEELREEIFKIYNKNSMSLYIDNKYKEEDGTRLYKLVNGSRKVFGIISTDTNNVISNIDIHDKNVLTDVSKYIGTTIVVPEKDNLIISRGIKSVSCFSKIIMIRNIITDELNDMIPSDLIFNSHAYLVSSIDVKTTCTIRYEGINVGKISLAPGNIIKKITFNKKFKYKIDMYRLEKFYGSKILLPWR